MVNQLFLNFESSLLNELESDIKIYFLNLTVILIQKLCYLYFIFSQSFTILYPFEFYKFYIKKLNSN
jgi:hypothetical protein